MKLSHTLTIHSHRLGRLVIESGQGWLVQITDSETINNFFDWLEGRKYHHEDSIEYDTGRAIYSGLAEIPGDIQVLRFRLSAEEGTDFYYQQRYHATENDTVQTLKEYLGRIKDPYFKILAGRLGLDRLMGEKINMLSTGEFRKAFVLKAAMAGPAVLLLEEPFAGVDRESTGMLNQLFADLIQRGVSVVVFSSGEDKPGFIDHAVTIGHDETDPNLDEISGILIPTYDTDILFDHAFILKKITASYNGRDVLHRVSWAVRRNEKWKLTGPNGAGKSTLLSFVNADNPQVYSNEVYLFDRKRGTGESIWEVKERIGFYSSELHRYFDKHQTAGDAIHSIVFQNPYHTRNLNPGEYIFREQLLKYLKLDVHLQKTLYELPVVTQKLVIIAGVLIKNAPLLILDEPFQGFDHSLISKINMLLKKYAENRTIIMVSHNDDFPEGLNNHFYIENGMGRESI